MDNIKEILTKRIEELTAALEKSAVNHHAVTGALNEAKYLLFILEGRMSSGKEEREKPPGESAC